MIAITLIFLYFSILFIGFRFVVPYLGFKKEIIPARLPKNFDTVILELNKQSKSDLDYLKRSYEYITNRFHGARMQTFTKWWYSFQDVFSHKSGYIPCNLHNFLLRIMLVKSGRFEEKDIRIRTVLFNFFIHQYLQVRLGDKWVNVDPNSRYMGISLGDRAFLLG